METGLFIVFEGNEFTGKSTQIDLLVKKMITAGMKTYVTGEADINDPIGKIIREEYLSGKRSMSQYGLLHLYTASRYNPWNHIPQHRLW